MQVIEVLVGGEQRRAGHVGGRGDSGVILAHRAADGFAVRVNDGVGVNQAGIIERDAAKKAKVKIELPDLRRAPLPLPGQRAQFALGDDADERLHRRGQKRAGGLDLLPQSVTPDVVNKNVGVE